MAKELGKIFNYPITSNFDWYSKFPWADDVVFSNKIISITIGEIILLWNIKRKVKKFPKYLSKNYVTDIGKELSKLHDGNVINNQLNLTNLGEKILNDNQKYIELHRNHWETPEDKSNNENLKKEQNASFYNWLLSLNLDNQASDFRIQKEQEYQDDILRDKFFEGEKLSKNNEIEKSNEILLPLVYEKFYFEPLYERLAINFRKLHDYEAEIKICKLFLKEIQPIYGGNAWVDVFKKRINKANSLLNK